MLSYRTDPQTGIVEISAEGRITREDVEEAYRRLDADIERQGVVKILERVGPLEGIDAAALWQDLKLAPSRVGKITHAAIVADQRWIRVGTSLASHFVKAEVRQFPVEQVDDARAWLAGNFSTLEEK